MHGTLARRPAPTVDNRWTASEDDVIRRLWPDKTAVCRALPHRTAAAASSRAVRLRVAHTDRAAPLTAREAKRIKELCNCFPTVPVIAAIMGRGEKAVGQLIAKRGWKLKKPAPILTGNRLFDAVRLRAHEMGITYRDLDISLGYRSREFSRPGKSEQVSIGMIANAVEALGGRLVIEWEPLDGEDHG